MKKSIFYFISTVIILLFTVSCTKNQELFPKTNFTLNPYSYVGKLHNQGLSEIFNLLKTQHNKNEINSENPYKAIFEGLSYFKNTLKDESAHLVTKSSTSVISVSGVVTNSITNEPMPGVVVMINGTYIGTTTNVLGEYQIQAPINSSLIFSYVGCYLKMYYVSNNSFINVQMDEAEDDVNNNLAPYIPQPSYEIGITSSSGQYYYNNLMDIILNGENDQAAINLAITELESDIISCNTLDESTKTSLLCGTATAISSIEYWLENYENWNSLNTSLGQYEMVATKSSFVVSGRVTDISTAYPIIGATVYEEGTYNGVITDACGDYSITVRSPNVILTFSYVGYNQVKVNVGGRSSIHVSLTESASFWSRIKKVAVQDVVGAIVGAPAGASVLTGSAASASAILNF